MIDYNHSRNLHSITGPRAALPQIFPSVLPSSILDVGCGTGTWLRAILDLGVTDVVAIDGVAIPPETLLFDPKYFQRFDLTQPINLGRIFDTVLCLEVAEHLDEAFASTLIQTLTMHADTIIFSAACPGQDGQHHVNCQWPEYWQQHFNAQGFVCEDTLRWRIWSDKSIEPWYRQNIFLARRDSEYAGKEMRIPAVLHPELFASTIATHISDAVRTKYIEQIKQGCMPTMWYIITLFRAIFMKINRKLNR